MKFYFKKWYGILKEVFDTYTKKEETKYILSSSFSLFFRFLLQHSIPARQVCHTFYTATAYHSKKKKCGSIHASSHPSISDY
jgi:hypothetical protein